MVTVGKHYNVKTKTTKKKHVFTALPCYVFSQKSTYSCTCKLEISGNSNLQPAFPCCGLEAIADNLANNMVLMWNWTALSSALTPQEQSGDTHWFSPSVIPGVFTSKKLPKSYMVSRILKSKADIKQSVCWYFPQSTWNPLFLALATGGTADLCGPLNRRKYIYIIII